MKFNCTFKLQKLSNIVSQRRVIAVESHRQSVNLKKVGFLSYVFGNLSEAN